MESFAVGVARVRVLYFCCVITPSDFTASVCNAAGRRPLHENSSSTLFFMVYMATADEPYLFYDYFVRPEKMFSPPTGC